MEKNLKIRYFFLLADYYWILFLKQMFRTFRHNFWRTKYLSMPYIVNIIARQWTY